MARLVTKFKFLNQQGKKDMGGYAKYIATREGVEKIDRSFEYAKATKRQENLIGKILRDFPDARGMLEYADYFNNPTRINASEFITRAIEENAYEALTQATYADYIATRPRAERFGMHGLFTDDGIHVRLEQVSAELNAHRGNVWTGILSLRREDAAKLGFDKAERWRDMLRSQVNTLANNLKIPLENFHWYAAFHNESHHPHVHLIAYSDVQNEGYLTEKGIANLRSAFAKVIFAEELAQVYVSQAQHRKDLRQESRDMIARIVERINRGVYDNPSIEEKLLELSRKLTGLGGKKEYQYLRKDLKPLVDDIVRELSSDDRITQLYDLWYQMREANARIYSAELPERIPLVDNPEFRTFKNAVIREAMHIVKQEILAEDPEEFSPDSVESFTTEATDSEQEGQARMFVLEDSEKRNRPYAQLLGSICSNRNWHAAIGSIRLMHHMSRIIQNQVEESMHQDEIAEVDKKIRQKTEEKRQAHGLKH